MKNLLPSEISKFLVWYESRIQWLFYYLFKINLSLKTTLKHAYLIDVKFIFDIACLGLFSSPNILQISRCRPLSCALAVLAMLLAIISPSSYSWNDWNVSHFFVFTTKTTEPRPQVFSVNGALTCKKAALLTSSVH